MYKTDNELVNETIRSLEKMYKQATKTFNVRITEKQQKLINKFDHSLKTGEEISMKDCIEIIKICGSIDQIVRQNFSKKTRSSRKSSSKKRK